jgi:hypothetical protein
VTLESPIDSDIGLAFWEKLFEGILDSLQTIRNTMIDGRGRYPEVGKNELED